MVKQGLSKSQAPKDDDDGQMKKRRTQPVALIGDAKKDKLKNSLGMSNEEKEKLVAREKDMSRNRGICMVRPHNCSFFVTTHKMILLRRVRSKCQDQVPTSPSTP